MKYSVGILGFLSIASLCGVHENLPLVGLRKNDAPEKIDLFRDPKSPYRHLFRVAALGACESGEADLLRKIKASS